jgi:ATP-dependent DNA helicase DinG
LTTSEIEDIFCKGGLLEKKMRDFEARDGQVEMCKLVDKAYREDAICVIEAGTGIGKSYAYLVPAIYNALYGAQSRTVIATATINLQDQLYNRDIKQLFAFLGVDCKVALAIGRRNYVCLERALQFLEKDPKLLKDSISLQSRFNSWLVTTEDGLLSNCNLKLGAITAKVNCDPDNCLKGKCPYYRQCFFMKAKEAQQQADIIITNHHMLFTDSKNRSEKDMGYDEDSVLPAFAHLVVDEAHNIEPVASEFYARIFDGREILRVIQRIRQKRTYGTEEESAGPVHVDTRTGARYLNVLEILSRFAKQGNDVFTVFDKLQQMEDMVHSFQSYMEITFARNRFRPVLISVQTFPRLAKDFVPAATKVIEACKALLSVADEFLAHLQLDAEEKTYLVDLQNMLGAIGESCANLAAFLDVAGWGDDIHWFEPLVGSDGKVVTIRVIISPLEVASLLEKNLYGKLSSIIFTSATLNLGDDFAFWCGRVGLPFGSDRMFLKNSFPSPFDYRNHLLLLTPYDAPAFARETEKQDAYHQALADAIFPAVDSSGGGALVLFTSRVSMQAVHDKLKEKFEKAHLSLMMQGENLGRQQLLEKFRENGNATLFALSSFWEGIDVPGSALRLVIIVKLPFPVPDHPVLRAKAQYLEHQNKSPFMYIQLPDAMMKMKQGFGRLIRKSDDQGVVLVLDPRLVTKQYGKLILRALPECDWQQCELASVADKIERFLFS